MGDMLCAPLIQKPADQQPFDHPQTSGPLPLHICMSAISLCTGLPTHPHLIDQRVFASGKKSHRPQESIPVPLVSSSSQAA